MHSASTHYQVLQPIVYHALHIRNAVVGESQSLQAREYIALELQLLDSVAGEVQLDQRGTGDKVYSSHLVLLKTYLSDGPKLLRKHLKRVVSHVPLIHVPHCRVQHHSQLPLSKRPTDGV